MIFSSGHPFLRQLQHTINDADIAAPVSLLVIAFSRLPGNEDASATMNLVQESVSDMVISGAAILISHQYNNIAILVINQDAFQSSNMARAFLDNMNKSYKNNISEGIYVGISSTVSKSVQPEVLVIQAKKALMHSESQATGNVTCHKDIVFANSRPGVKTARYHFE